MSAEETKLKDALVTRINKLAADNAEIKKGIEVIRQSQIRTDAEIKQIVVPSHVETKTPST